MSAAGLRVAIVGSAMYAADDALERRLAELEPGAIVILGGEPGFQERVQTLATAGGIETVTPGAGPRGPPPEFEFVDDRQPGRTRMRSAAGVLGRQLA